MNTKKSNPIVFTFLFALTLVGSGALCYWQWGKVQEVSQKVSKIEKELASKAELQRAAINAQNELATTIEELNHLESSLSTLEYIPTLLRDLQATGESCRLKITGVRPIVKAATKKPKKKDEKEAEEKPQRKPYEDVDIEVKCKGVFQNVMAFLKRLEQFPKIVGVRSVALSPEYAGDSGKLKSIEASIRIRVYIFPSVPIGKDPSIAQNTNHNLGGTS